MHRPLMLLYEIEYSSLSDDQNSFLRAMIYRWIKSKLMFKIEVIVPEAYPENVL